MEYSFRLRFLGPAQIKQAGQPMRGLGSGKALALLGYLAVQDHSVSREFLADLFWPDKPANRGRANLSWLIHRICKHLPGCMHVSRHTVRFQCESSYWLDLSAFTELVSRGDVAALENAAELYRGDFLDGIYLKGCANFEIWLVGERERWRRRVVQVLRDLVTYHDCRGDYKQGLHYARRILAIEPWLEDTHHQVMRLLTLDDQRSAALTQYEICERILDEELGVAPGPETKQLYAQIRDGTLPTSHQPGTAALDLDIRGRQPSFLDEAVPVDVDVPAFVSRQRELSQLDGYLDSALAGKGQVVFVTGEAGLGKTALIQEFAHRAQAAHSDLLVAGGKGNAHTGVGDPYLPFREALNQLSGDVQASWEAGAMTGEQTCRLWHNLPMAAKAIVETGPDLVDTFIPGGQLLRRSIAYSPGNLDWLTPLEGLVERKAATPADPSLHQIALFGQYTRVLQMLASRGGLLLVLDDLQWADSGTISLLFHLGRELSGHRILVVGAYRPSEVALMRVSSGSVSTFARESDRIEAEPERHPLLPVIHEFQRAYGEIEVFLIEDDPFFVDAFLDSEPNNLSDAFRQTLYRQTAGHPLFTVELLRGMQERGDLVKDGNGCWVEGPALDWGILPARVEAVIAERISRLPEQLQEALSIASVEGETFTAEVLAQASEAGEEEMLRCLSGDLDRRHRLVRAQGVRQIGSQSISRYRFRHILFQKYLYTDLDAVERSHLHRAVGLKLEALYASRDDKTEEIAGIAGELARHFQEGGVPEKAVVYLIQAGQRATRLSANEEATAHFTRGLALLDMLPQSQARDQLELALQVGLAVPQLSIKGFAAPEVGCTYARALELCQQFKDTPQHFQVLWLSYSFFTTRGDHKKAYKLGKQLFSLAERVENPMFTAQAHWALGWSLFYFGQLLQAYNHMEQVIAFYKPGRFHSLTFLYGQDPSSSSRSQFSWILWLMGYPEQALEQSRGAITLAQELSHPFSLAFAQGLSALLHTLRLDSLAAKELSEACILLSTEHGFAYWISTVLCFHGWALTVQGQIEEGLEQMSAGAAKYQATGAEMGRPQQLAMLAMGYGKAGDVEKGLNLLQEAFTVVQRNEERFYEAEIQRLKGDLLLKLDGDESEMVHNNREAEICFKHAIKIAQRQDAKMWELRSTVSLARLWQQQGKHEESRQMLAEIFDWFTEGFDTPDLRDAKTLLDELTKS